MESPLQKKLDRKWIEASQRIVNLEVLLDNCKVSNIELERQLAEAQRVTFDPKVLKDALKVARDALTNPYRATRFEKTRLAIAAIDAAMKGE